jgi:ferritin-like metal-binding protein YciE
VSPTLEAVRAWVGREAVDADGQHVGQVAHAYRDEATGAPAWLAIAAQDGAARVVPVPLAGAEETGRAIRLAVLGDTVRGAPRMASGAGLSPEQARIAAAHYGLPGPPPPPRAADVPPAVEPRARRPIVAKLREAYALEGEGILRLHALVATVPDPEVRHDATLHANVSQLHRTGVEERLKALERSPSALRTAAHGLRAAARSARGTLVGGGAIGALREAEAFERREAAFYAELEQLARGAGDGPTGDLAAAHRAEEEAMAATLAATLRRLDRPA